MSGMAQLETNDIQDYFIPKCVALNVTSIFINIVDKQAVLEV